MAILTPDKVSKWNGVKVNEYLFTKHNPYNIAMPTASLPSKPLGITVHNTDWITVSSSTTPAEQYTRATVNGNMNDVRVHFYVDDKCAWQNLPLTLSGWHAADGGGNGNRKTIAIECIMRNSNDEVSLKSEENCAKLVAYLLNKYGLSVDTGLFTHTHWLNVRDGRRGAVNELNTMKHSYKMCPLYILPHWEKFRDKVRAELKKLQGESAPIVPDLYRIRKTWEDSSSQIGAYAGLENAKNACKDGYFVFDKEGKIVYPIEEEKVEVPKIENTKTEDNKIEEKPMAAEPKNETINIKYRSYSNGKWWSEIINCKDNNDMGYSGIEGKPIRGFAATADKGSLKYRVHIKGGGWLGWMTGYDISNWVTGCAGNKIRDIDAIQMDFSGIEGYEVRYRVSTIKSKSYLNWIEGYNTKNSMGYSGIFGQAIDKIQVEIIKK